MSGKYQMTSGSCKRYSVLFVILAAAFFVMGLWKLVGVIRFVGVGEKITAVVESVDEKTASRGPRGHSHETAIIYAIYVDYTYQGQTYQYVQLDGYDAAYEGKELEVSVNKNNPLDVRLPGNNLYQAVFMILMLPVLGAVARWFWKHSGEM